MEPWTQMVQVQWPPELRFYEEYIHVLRRLEDDSRLVAFRVDGNRVAARIGLSNELEVYPDGLLLTTAGAVAPDQTGQDILRVVFDLLQPKALLRLHVMLQYVVPLDARYDEVRQVGLRRLLRIVPPGSDDYAFLLTGNETDGSSWSVEFGVINRAEGPPRVTRSVGKMVGIPSPGRAAITTTQGVVLPSLGGIHQASNYPEVALFFDWTWIAALTPSTDLCDAVITGWQRAVKVTQHVSDLLDATLKIKDTAGTGV